MCESGRQEQLSRVKQRDNLDVRLFSLKIVFAGRDEDVGCKDVEID